MSQCRKRTILQVVIWILALTFPIASPAPSTTQPSSGLALPSYKSSRASSKKHMTNRDAVAGVSAAATKKEFAGTANPSIGRPLTSRRQRRKNEDESIYWISSLISGICSGTVSSIACAPLDLVRTRLQVWGGVVVGSGAAATTKSGAAVTILAQRQRTTAPATGTILQIFRDIIKRDGWQGCFRGLTATLFTVPAFWGVYCKYSTSFPSLCVTKSTSSIPSFCHSLLSFWPFGA
jgi:Mitochondrial carrier protein